MYNFMNTSGTITCPSGMCITVKSIQTDVADPSVTDINVTLSGVSTGAKSFSAVSPIVAEIDFGRDEDINITSTGTGLNTVSINYIYRAGKQEYNMRLDPDRNPTPLPWRFR